MRRSVLFLICLAVLSAVHAQQNTGCALQRLFTIKAGISRQAVVDSVQGMYGLSPTAINTKNAGIATDNMQKEQLSFVLNDMDCFKGKTNKIQFEFSNGKLDKAYITASFARVDYYDMMENFNLLRRVVRSAYAYEKEIKASNERLVSYGYDFSNTKKFRDDKISLCYIRTKPDNSYGTYLLQLFWVNTGNTGLEVISY